MSSEANRALYAQICYTHSDIPVYSQHWWLSAVCGSRDWDVIFSVGADGKVLGSMPYIITRRMGLSVLSQPLLCQHLGVHIYYPSDISERRRRTLEEQVCADIIRQIETMNVSLAEQNFSPRFTNWLPFHWADFHQTTRYNYVITDISDTERVLASFSENKRRLIKKAQQNGITTTFDMSAEEFCRFHIEAFRQRGESDMIDTEALQRVASAAITNDRGRVVACKDKNGKTLSAFMLVWDDMSGYFIAPAVDNETKDSGASTLMIWEAICMLSERGVTTFDFEGSMDQGIGGSYSQFGTSLIPYMRIEKYYSPLMRLIRKAQTALRR